MRIEELKKRLGFMQEFSNLFTEPVDSDASLDKNLSELLKRVSDVEPYASYTSDYGMAVINDDVKAAEAMFYRFRTNIKLSELAQEKIIKVFKLCKTYCDQLCPYKEVKSNPMLCAEKTNYADCLRNIKTKAFELLKEKGIDPYNLPKD